MKSSTTICPDKLRGDITLVTFTANNGTSVTVSTLGAGITSVIVPDKNGELADVVLGYEDVNDYRYDGPCMGKTAGRYANRIGRGLLTINGHQYQLPVNCGPHHLHGGPEGFQNRIWTIDKLTDNSVRMTLISADGDMGYPGNINVEVIYTINESDSDKGQFDIRIDFKASSDAPTVINLTNHTYWNLDGHDAGCALDHKLQLNASRYLITEPALCPTGEFAEVVNTPMDFTSAKTLAKDIYANFTPLKDGKGYDHCWLLDSTTEIDQRGITAISTGAIGEAATLYSPRSGRTLKILTDQPGIQVYTGNWLTGSPIGKGKHEYHDYDAVALECQALPDAPNHPNFPSTLLLPDAIYSKTIIYRLSLQ